MHRLSHIFALGALFALVAFSSGPRAEVAGTSLGPMSWVQTAASPTPALSTPAQPHPVERALFDLVNADRARNHLPALTVDLSLLPVARSRADSQLADGPLNHYDSHGQLAFVPMLAGSGISYTLAGENLARSSGPDSGVVQRVEDALMRSPTHRKNILDPTFTRLAVGAAWDQSGHVTFAQIFRDTP